MSHLRVMVDLGRGLNPTHLDPVGVDGIWNHFASWYPDLIEVTEKWGRWRGRRGDSDNLGV